MNDDKPTWEEIEEKVKKNRVRKCPYCQSKEIAQLITPGFYECENCMHNFIYKEFIESKEVK